jgi:release factor glutamine methyltransferase
MTGAEALRQAVPRLRAAGVEDPPGDARRLLAHALDLSPDRLTLHLGEPVPPHAAGRFAAALSAREARRPVAQITGRRLFWGRAFRVTPDTLDPRPETEVLVAEALAAPFAQVLDLGTGTGCILLSLLADRPLATGLGTDRSAAALAVARANASDFGLSDRVAWAEADWFAGLSGTFDLIVSNPPYIAASEMASLDPEVRLHEPRMALTDDGDGLTAYRAIASDARRHLRPGGRLLVEIGPTQGPAVRALFAHAGLGNLRVLPDLDGRDRVVAAQSQGA